MVILSPRGPRCTGTSTGRDVDTIAARIREAIRYKPLDDDVLAFRLAVGQRPSINQAVRRLEAQGRLRRYVGGRGKIVNALVDVAPVPRFGAPLRAPGKQLISEDEVKLAVRDHLATQGFEIAVA